MQIIQELIDRTVLTPFSQIEPIAGGTVVICDGETDPTLIVPRNISGSPVRVISNEIGVYSCKSDYIVVNPLKRAFSDGFRRVILVANPKAVWGRLCDTLSVSLVDTLMRARATIATRLLDKIELVCVVHVPTDDGDRNNYSVDESKWLAWYDEFERRVLAGQDDADFEAVPDDIDDNPDHEGEFEELAFALGHH